MVLIGTITPFMDDELQKETGLDLQTYDALLHVHEAGDRGIRMSDLARSVVLSKSGLTTLVDRLEDRGLLRRVADPDDRRAIRITLTERGRARFRGAAEVHVTGIDRYFASHLTEGEAGVVANVLERIQSEVGATGS
jgi:DNA-binding MarR family transcriptional regulator